MLCPLTFFYIFYSYFDIEISDLKIAKESDVEGKIILVVLTRLDIMNKGIDAWKVLLNQEINLN